MFRLLKISIDTLIYFLLLISVIVGEQAFADTPLITTADIGLVYRDAQLDADVIANLIAGDRVIKKDERGDFYQIDAYRGMIVGWVKKSDLAPLGSVPGPKSIKAGPSPALPDAKAFKIAKRHAQPHGGGYQGVQYCQQCHNRSTGRDIPGGSRPTEVWARSPHARAFRTLFQPKAAEIGRRYGISQPFKAPQCLKCHVTGYGSPSSVSSKIVVTEGVGCETCHGPSGGLHKSGTAWDAQALGKREAFCKKCHNSESPTFKGFDLERDSELIAHWDHYSHVSDLKKDIVKQRCPKGPGQCKQGDSADIPEVITLDHGVNGPVHFPHAKHSGQLGIECSSCHHREQKKCSSCHGGEGMMSRKHVFHDTGLRRDSCVSCHQKRGGSAPLGCSEGCHQLSGPTSTTTSTSEEEIKPPPSGPEVVLFEGKSAKSVSFPHKKHQGMITDCTTCHHKPGVMKCRDCHSASDDIPLQTAFHDGAERACRTCHRAKAKEGMDAPRQCSYCHTGP